MVERTGLHELLVGAKSRRIPLKVSRGGLLMLLFSIGVFASSIAHANSRVGPVSTARVNITVSVMTQYKLRSEIGIAPKLQTQQQLQRERFCIEANSPQFASFIMFELNAVPAGLHTVQSAIEAPYPAKTVLVSPCQRAGDESVTFPNQSLELVGHWLVMVRPE